MAHTIKNKQKLINRIRRIRGQAEAIERALEQEQDCTVILQTIAACRGAINSLMAEVIEGQIRYHVIEPKRSALARMNRAAKEENAQAAEELIAVIKTYMK
jgi:DNA-binding FrmR family transcriptional regulator